jgi:glutathione synthase/RimK-type ligase-like ATP-grasp enzyme
VAKIAILTPDPADEASEMRWPEVMARTAEPLRRAGLSVEAVAWTEEADWTSFDLVLPLLVWGYPRAHRRWLERVSALEGRGVPLRNPAPVLRWNADKTYLGRLAERGAPVLPAMFVDRLDEAAMHAAAERFGCDRLVAKPQISSGAWRTIRWSPGEKLDGGPEGAAIIQPYLPEIERSGEVSLLFFGGRFSHAVRKLPQPGDFRVQPEHDGIISAHVATGDERAAAERCLAVVEEDLLYARVDLVRGRSGAPELIELELIEPDLYLGYDPENGLIFTEAVVELIAR